MLITEIALKARVSPATVSRAINQPQLVAAESLARIRAVMEQHNYVPAPLNRRRVSPNSGGSGFGSSARGRIIPA
jgi:DNA-binding LacI/PurR family transcriptional regulator